jgi:hypothetical protein
MNEAVYTVTWECISCSQEHSFRYTPRSDDDWPNKFEFTCTNPECGQQQDVPFRHCTVEAFTLPTTDGS